MDRILVSLLVLGLAGVCFAQEYLEDHHFGASKDERQEKCAIVECGLGERCILDENREAKCVCSQVCTTDYSPVCATNGRTYSNICTMEVEACLNGIYLQPIMYRDCQFVFICGGAIVFLAVITFVLLIVLVVRCCARRKQRRSHLAFIVDDYTSDAFIHRSSDIYKPTTMKGKSVQYDKLPILTH